MKEFLLRHRTSSRLAFVLQTATRIASAALSLLWIRLILHILGASLYGQFSSFLAASSLGGLGDFAMGSAVGLTASQILSEGDRPKLARFLAVARGLFLILIAASSLLWLVLAPFLPRLLGFSPVPGSGSLTLLFMLCAPATAACILNSYVSNLNYAAVNVTWPIIPIFLAGQLTLAGQYFAARCGAPLWVQFTPYIICGFGGIFAAWLMVKSAEPAMAKIWPISFAWSEAAPLLARSGWIYLVAVSAYIYLSTDRLLINAALGPALLPSYQLNYKACELILFTIAAASYVTMPKITRWLAATDEPTRQRALKESVLLNNVISFAGSAAAIIYLGLNDIFVYLWLGPKFQAPLLWQAAFAANLAITTACTVSMELCTRSGDDGPAAAGKGAALSAVLNLALSGIAITAWHSPLGVALATVIAQCFQALYTGWHATGRLALQRGKWFANIILWPLLSIAAAAALRIGASGRTEFGLAIYFAGSVIIIFALARAYGIDRDMIMREWNMLVSKAPPTQS